MNQAISQLKQIDGKIERLEKELALENEKRRELINYYGLNKQGNNHGKGIRHNANNDRKVEI